MNCKQITVDEAWRQGPRTINPKVEATVACVLKPGPWHPRTLGKVGEHARVGSATALFNGSRH